MSDLKNIRDQFISKLKNELSLDEINSIKTELFGKMVKFHLYLKQ